MGGWFFLAAAITLAAPQGSGQAPAEPIAVPAPPPVVPAVVLAPIPADGEIERFLKEADVVSTKSTKKGVTDSLHATLSDGKLTHDAHIQNIDETKREFRTNQGVEFDFRDSWMFNVAAYKIDRLIGLNMVPPSISRSHRSTPAAFTWWIDDVLMDEGGKVKNKVEAPDSNRYLRQRAMMHVFDELISNVDRNQGNIIYTKDWRLWLIDHTRAFRKNTALKVPARITRCDRQVYEGLKALDRETLKAEVGKQLDDGQIKSLLARRDAIVKKLDSLGPSALFDRNAPAVTPPGSAAAAR
jgi:hypothetical protein